MKIYIFSLQYKKALNDNNSCKNICWCTM